ncbi:hypothetical protein [Kangiella koreensis]|uniref:TonB-dependent receptor n=1 Tax=Kangiella koreensis (strain DSM 16069 / JCM 12317 / KCTC 12182 / SW-125) TaxID=523791 RepID=C7RAY2_KANKD|nr:hypothetical protein [Kangiella koreensis]ACV26424.1 TonB-dependent receptor [Kangiella koreensis DSM 16069]
MKNIKNLIVLIFFFLTIVISGSLRANDVETIVVTGSRIDWYDSPAVTLVKPADYLVQQVKLLNDSRDQTLREKELTSTVKDILKSANKSKLIELGVGKEIVYPITLDDLQLDFEKGERTDTSVVNLYIKTPINNKNQVEKLVTRINDFIVDISVSGRTEVEKNGELVLSIVNPEKYRQELLAAIAKDVNSTIEIFGDNYKADIDGLSQSLMWERASVSELRLYLEYDFTLIAK